MKHFIAFQKRKGLFLPLGNGANQSTAYQIQAELFKYGFVLNRELFNSLASQPTSVLEEVYSDLCQGLRELFGTDGYEPIYRNFPQSVQNMDYMEFLVNAVMHYWSFGTWRPEDEGYMHREFKLEPGNYKELRLLTEGQFNSIFTDIVYSGSSISKWDKAIVDWFIDSGNSPELNFGKISFKETKAYIGKRYLENGLPLPVKSATDVLRIYTAFCGGDEGLKESTEFKQPKRSVKRSLMETLEDCYDLEESFKNYREIWLRVLFYLNPLTEENRKKYPVLSVFGHKLRNHPKSLRTFNSYLEKYIADANPEVFELLKKRKGVFMRRMNQLFDCFGIEAIDEFIKAGSNFDQLVTLYNYFSDRDQEKERAVILASQSKSNVETFGALKALAPQTVARIQKKLMDAIVARVKRSDTKIFVDRSLYYSPLATNNRASNFSLDSNAIGKVEKLPDDGKIIRAYVHWCGSSDIDLSGFVIDAKNQVQKVGWNGIHTLDKAITYSGDNTGHSAKNAEYLDLNVPLLNDLGAVWVVVEANVYRGSKFKSWGGEGVHAGWMTRKHPEANKLWLPETVSNAMKLSSDTNSAYLMAIHVPTKNLVYLDVSNRQSNVTNESDALKMRSFLEKFIVLDDGSEEINWKKMGQGHVLNLLGTVVDKAEEADLIFDENTTWETVAKAINEETI